ncbi:MAG: nucleotidyltransferase [Epsilonproteobacteria bacterium]|nr:MAG: nucleotidyltransferase [Campylobacterota bacterium]
MDKVKAQIEELLYENAEDFKIAKVLKQEIKRYFETLENTFATSGGKDFLVKHTQKIDSILELVHRVALRSMFGDYAPMKNSVPLALVALGSYGREQLCVHSDIDLMLVYKEIPGYNSKEMIEKILYILWDTGLKLGHRVHTVEELFDVSKTDITIKTALIESRFIEGSHFIWTETQNTINKIRKDDVQGFVSDKIVEQERKHLKYPITMEPNLKDGMGGFRDANLVFWMGKVLYNTDNIKSLPSNIIDEKEYKTFRIALEFLFRVRSALHLVAKKKEDKLRLDLIPDVARLLGYKASKKAHMDFASKVTGSLKTIRLYSIIWLDTLTAAYKKEDISKNYIYPQKDNKDLNSILKQLISHASKPFKAHPKLLQQLSNVPKPERLDKDLYASIASLFYQPHIYAILSTLSYAKLLKYSIPPIKKVVDLPQFDGYHKYAVDTHSLRCVYHLEHIKDTFIEGLLNAMSAEEQAMLKLVVFLHDAGKGRHRDHHYVGASLFKIFASKLQLSTPLIKMGETLITYHTLMSKIAQREDIYSETVILSFASHFKTQKLLDMIYVLTYADMNGVGKGIYNSFSAKLIRTLYKRSIEILAESKMLNEAEKRSKKIATLRRNETFKSLSKSKQNKIVAIPSNLLFLRYSPQRILAITQKAFKTENYSFHITNEKHLSIEIIRKESFNLSYLLEKLSALDVVNMDICKLFDTLKYFKIDFAQTLDEEEASFLEEIIAKSFEANLTVKPYNPKIQASEVDIDCEHSKTYGIMHLNASNQKGLLSFIIDLFDEMGIDIVTAKVHTLKNRARDMFLIEKNGNFCHNAESIIKKLTQGC